MAFDELPERLRDVKMPEPDTVVDHSEKCPYCGASLKMFWHKLTPGLVLTLVKIHRAIAKKKENRIHTHKEMTLTTSEHMNMTKLRFHGLIAKCRKDGKIERGYWLITRRGAQFLRGEIAVPKRVQTFRNKVVNHDLENVTIKDVMKSTPFFETFEDFEYEFADIQNNLFDGGS